jgi:hypothetical protein
MFQQAKGNLAFETLLDRRGQACIKINGNFMRAYPLLIVENWYVGEL